MAQMSSFAAVRYLLFVFRFCALRAQKRNTDKMARTMESNYESQYGQTHAGLPEDTINFQHDALACAIALGWNEGVEISDIRLTFEIKDGWLYQKVDDGGKSTRIVTRVHGDRFNEHWLRTVVRKNAVTPRARA